VKRRTILQLSGSCVGLTAFSTVVRHFLPRGAAPANRRFARLKEITIAYRDSDPEGHRPPVLLIHGSPGSASVFDALTPYLADRFRVIAVDLPGFGWSTHDLPDYSNYAHARYLAEFLDKLRISRLQIVGFSMGGGVALWLSQMIPQKIASIVMLSAVGVQEQELTGSYWLNHFIHGVQLAGLWTARNFAPHFGYLDRMSLNVEYARNFYDTDQRPLSDLLRRYRGPMLILHGDQDRNVPVAAAYEHKRLAARSELMVVPGNHFLTFQRPEVIAGPLVKFLLAHSVG
jgi:pimeloyl-ACP methyl ester carboxylesterase